MGRCDKIVKGAAVRDRLTGKGYCCKKGKAEITYNLRHNLIRYFYCEEHLDAQIRRTFKDGVANLMLPGRTVVKKDVETLIETRACISNDNNSQNTS